MPSGRGSIQEPKRGMDAYMAAMASGSESPDLPGPIADWFAARGWAPRRHQLEMLAAARAGRSALLVAPTGAGKTMAGFLPSLVELIEAKQNRSSRAKSRGAG